MLHNNYCRYYYNNKSDQIIRKNLYDKWAPHFNSDIKNVKTFKKESLHSCELIYDRLREYTPILNLFFSGGMDSECMLRCFNELKIPVNPVVIVHYYIPNSEESRNAFNVCNELKIKPTIFNLNFHEIYSMGKFHELGIKYQTARLGMLELLYVLEKINEPSVLADDIQLVYRSSDRNLLSKVDSNYLEWLYELREDEDGVFYRFEELTGIPLISDFFRYTPESWAAMLLTDNVKDIVFNDRGKASALTTKNTMMSKEFGTRNREKTNVFLCRPHINLRDKLKNELQQELNPSQVIRIEYTKLLGLLGIVDAL